MLIGAKSRPKNIRFLPSINQVFSLGGMYSPDEFCWRSSLITPSSLVLSPINIQGLFPAEALIL